MQHEPNFPITFFGSTPFFAILAFLTLMLQAILVKKYASHGQNCGNLKFWSLNPSICLIPIFLSEHPGAMRLNLFMSEPKQMVFQSARNLEDNGLWNLNGSYRPLHHSQNTRKRERGQGDSEAITVLKKKTIKVKGKKLTKTTPKHKRVGSDLIIKCDQDLLG